MRRYETNYFDIPADTNDHKSDFHFTTDDYRDVSLETLFVGLNVARVRVKIVINAVPLANVDTSYFTAGNGALPIDGVVPAQVHLQVVLTDDTGTGRTAVPIVIGYSVPSGR